MDKLVTGIVKRSHGVKGFLRVKSLSGETRHFLNLEAVYIKDGNREIEYNVEAIKIIGGGDILLKLEGIDTPEYGKRFIGREILVDREKAAPLGEGEYYIADLYNCAVFFDNRHVGQVKSVMGGGRGEFLEIMGDEGRVLIIPFDKYFIENVDIENKIVIINKENYIW